MLELDYEAEPLIVSFDICKVLKMGIEDLDCNVDGDVEDGQYPSDMAPRTYEKIEEALRKEGINIEELNNRINKAMFGKEYGIKYYPYKDV